MSASSKEIFRLSWRSPLIGVIVIIFSVLFVYAWPHVALLVLLAIQFVFVLFMSLFTSIVTVSEDGLVIARVNKLPWPQVESVRRASVLGLPYLLITRHKGFRWWLPLYLSGDRRIEAALAEKAPIGNPIRIYAEENT